MLLQICKFIYTVFLNGDSIFKTCCIRFCFKKWQCFAKAFTPSPTRLCAILMTAEVIVVVKSFVYFLFPHCNNFWNESHTRTIFCFYTLYGELLKIQISAKQMFQHFPQLHILLFLKFKRQKCQTSKHTGTCIPVVCLKWCFETSKGMLIYLKHNTKKSKDILKCVWKLYFSIVCIVQYCDVFKPKIVSLVLKKKEYFLFLLQSIFMHSVRPILLI